MASKEPANTEHQEENVRSDSGITIRIDTVTAHSSNAEEAEARLADNIRRLTARLSVAAEDQLAADRLANAEDTAATVELERIEWLVKRVFVREELEKILDPRTRREHREAELSTAITTAASGAAFGALLGGGFGAFIGGISGLLVSRYLESSKPSRSSRSQKPSEPSPLSEPPKPSKE